MPMDPSRLCACHGVPMYRRPDGKHRCNERRKAAQRRFQLTPGGRVVITQNARRRLFMGDRLCGVAATAALAKDINAYIKRRRRAFQGGQCPSPEIHDRSGSGS